MKLKRERLRSKLFRQGVVDQQESDESSVASEPEKEDGQSETSSTMNSILEAALPRELAPALAKAPKLTEHSSPRQSSEMQQEVRPAEQLYSFLHGVRKLANHKVADDERSRASSASSHGDSVTKKLRGRIRKVSQEVKDDEAELEKLKKDNPSQRSATTHRAVNELQTRLKERSAELEKLKKEKATHDEKRRRVDQINLQAKNKGPCQCGRMIDGLPCAQIAGAECWVCNKSVVKGRKHVNTIGDRWGRSAKHLFWSCDMCWLKLGVAEDPAHLRAVDLFRNETKENPVDLEKDEDFMAMFEPLQKRALEEMKNHQEALADFVWEDYEGSLKERVAQFYEKKMAERAAEDGFEHLEENEVAALP